MTVLSGEKKKQSKVELNKASAPNARLCAVIDERLD